MAEFRSELDTRVVPSGFVLLAPLIYYSDLLGREVVVPTGYPTDFASIPPILQSLIQVNGPHRPAAVVHDRLCTHGEEEGLSQAQADWILLEAMKALGVRFTQRWAMYLGVRAYQVSKGLLKKVLP